MLAQNADEVVDTNGLLDLYGAVARQAVKDYQAGPAVVGSLHFATAERFLHVAGLIERVRQKRGGGDCEDAIVE